MTRESDIGERLLKLRGDYAGAMIIQEAAAEIERLTAKIVYVRQRSQRACEILNEFDNTRAALDHKP